MFKANDLVRVVKQSSTINNHIRTVGMSGFIEEIVGDYAQFVELREDGLGGMGGVPLDCLELANDDARLQRLKKKRDEYYEKLRNEAMASSKKYKALKDKYVAEACQETGVSKQNVEKIFEIANKFEDDWNYYG